MSEPRITIVDYEAGNVRSVQKAFQKVGGQASITSDLLLAVKPNQWATTRPANTTISSGRQLRCSQLP